MQGHALHEAATALEQFLTNVEQIDDRGSTARFRGDLNISGKAVNIEMRLDRHFPLTVPAFTIHPWDALGEIPHVVPGTGLVCPLSPEGMVLDESRPGDIVQDAFARVYKVLLDGVLGRNREDFTDEFEACWSYLDLQEQLQMNSAPCQHVETLDLIRNRIVARTASPVERFEDDEPRDKGIQRNVVLNLPLEAGSFIQPPRPDRPFWTANDLRRILVDQLSDRNKHLLNKVLRKKRSRPSHIIVSLPRCNGGESLFGITLSGIGPVHPLLPSGTAETITPALIIRTDRKYLLGRGGSATSFEKKKVLVVGCGSLGGRIATELVRTGISSVTLVDHDNLAPENTFRHVLGKTYWCQNKAKALKHALSSQVPHINVRAIDLQIQDAIHDGIVHFEQYDAVVFALGNPTVELHMNRLFSKLDRTPPVIYSWIEPLGIGGHALLVQPGIPGCFQCLYEDLYDPMSGLYNKASFAAPNQFFGRALTGCGTMFTPYSSLDAATTANLACRLVIDTLTGSESGNPLVSWKGSSSNFEAENFQLSERFSLSDEQINDHRYSYPTGSCPVCKQRSTSSIGKNV